jgi:two-component system response regulator FixJ
MKTGSLEPVPTRTVLVIDDDPAVLNSLRFALEIEGYGVRTYSTGAELLAASDWPISACLVIDLGLHDMDGLGLLRALRARGVSLPAILITTNPKPMIRQRAAAEGMQIVEKPLLGNALTEAIRKALNGERADTAK